MTSYSGELPSRQKMSESTLKRRLEVPRGAVSKPRGKGKPISMQPCNIVAGCSSGAAVLPDKTCCTVVVGDSVASSCSQELPKADLAVSTQTARKRRRPAASRTTEAENVLVEGVPYRCKSKRFRAIESMSEAELGSCGTIETSVGSAATQRKRRSTSSRSTKRGPAAKK